MALNLDLPALLTSITDLADTMDGVRQAFNYDEWPDAPPANPTQDQVYHLTAFPGETAGGVRYFFRGSDLAEYEIVVPLYTVVAPSGMYKRARLWAAPFYARYIELFRDNLHLSAQVTSGSAVFQSPSIVVRSIPLFEGYDDFYMLRHLLTVHTKGSHANSL